MEIDSKEAAELVATVQQASGAFVETLTKLDALLDRINAAVDRLTGAPQ